MYQMNTESSRFNAFSARLTGYMAENHPDRIDDVEFINRRGEAAASIFRECSVEGLSVDECMSRAMQTLYKGLLFSPYLMVRDIVENHFIYTEDEEEMGEFTMQMLDMVRPLIDSYQPGDDFGGSYDRQVLEAHIIQCITDYLSDNGLQ